MPVSLAFRFVAGRYHATPYGHHVNEGLIEWPPSPWRLIRSLISVGYTSGAWNSDGPSMVARNLMEKLSVHLPCYHLPSAVGTHSRHYMPTGKLNSETKIEEKTLVFDTWARIEDKELVVNWRDMHLGDDELITLRILVDRLNYLGRSESWVEGRLVNGDEPIPEVNCFPEQSGNMPGRCWEQVALLAPVSASDFEDWRRAQLEKALADFALPGGKKPTKALLDKRAKAAAPYPADLLDCLQKDTTWTRSYGWSQPPGSRRVFYWRPSDAISVGAPKARTGTRSEKRVEAMLLALTNASRNDHALPPVIRTLPQAELLHRAVVGAASRKRAPPPEITGRDENRQPLKGPHEHAHINALDLDGDGHLDHILIWAPMGLGANAQAAIRALRRTFTKGGVEPLRLGLAGTGALRDLVQLSGIYGRRLAPLISENTVWQSVTPFVPPRYMKPRGKNTIEGQIRTELESRGLPEPAQVRRLVPIIRNGSDTHLIRGATFGGDAVNWNRFRHFNLARKHGPTPPVAHGFAIRLEFERPVSGPLAIGYGSHFGLGLFGGVVSGAGKSNTQ